MKIVELLLTMAKRLLEPDIYRESLSLVIGILKRLLPCGQSGPKHPNDKFPFIHRETFVGGIHHRHRSVERVSHTRLFCRDVLGFRKRLAKQKEQEK